MEYDLRCTECKIEIVVYDKPYFCRIPHLKSCPFYRERLNPKEENDSKIN